MLTRLCGHQHTPLEHLHPEREPVQSPVFLWAPPGHSALQGVLGEWTFASTLCVRTFAESLRMAKGS